jgi:predicted nuclease with RNAse H fold
MRQGRIAPRLRATLPRLNPPVRTLGIDLASQNDRTAMATVTWAGGRAVAGVPVSPVSDSQALTSMASADWVGIDAPFGWPEAVVRALPQFAEGGTWPEADRDALRFRETDRFVHEKSGIWPLSVSSDRIAVPAWRCARLLASRPGTVDRLGGDRVAEVYPGAALKLWGFERRGYKTSGDRVRQERQRAARRLLVAEIERRGARWLDLAAAREACIESDHALDAVLASLLARAVARGLTWPPPEGDVVRREGWIHLPRPGTFDALA